MLLKATRISVTLVTAPFLGGCLFVFLGKELVVDETPSNEPLPASDQATIPAPVPTQAPNAFQRARTKKWFVPAVIAVVLVVLSCGTCGFCATVSNALNNGKTTASAATATTQTTDSQQSQQPQATAVPTMTTAPVPTTPPFKVTYSGKDNKTTAPIAVPDGTWYISWTCKPNGNDSGFGAILNIEVDSARDGSQVDFKSVNCPPGGLHDRMEEQGGDRIYLNVGAVGVDWTLLLHQ